MFSPGDVLLVSVFFGRGRLFSCCTASRERVRISRGGGGDGDQKGVYEDGNWGARGDCVPRDTSRKELTGIKRGGGG